MKSTNFIFIELNERNDSSGKISWTKMFALYVKFVSVIDLKDC